MKLLSHGYADIEKAHSSVRPFSPVSWFHDRGRVRVLKRLMPRLPNVEGCRFITLTLDGKPFGGDQEAAFEAGNDRIRRVFFALRKGVRWEGKLYRDKSPYCVKLEFQQSGMAHWHLIFLSKKFLPFGLVAKLWGLGDVEVDFIRNEDFHYLLKYVTKDNGPLPEWVLRRKSIRIFRASHGFWLPSEKSETEPEGRDRAPVKRGALCSIGERLHRWEHQAVFREGAKHSHLLLSRPYKEISDKIVLREALAGRYAGNEKYIITKTGDLEIWIQNSQPKSQPLPPAQNSKTKFEAYFLGAC